MAFALRMNFVDVVVDDSLKHYPVLRHVFSDMFGFVQFKNSCDAELEGLKKIMPHCFEMHGKFHYIDENLHEPAIPYEKIIPVVAATDFDGYIVTEFEDLGMYDTFEQTTRHIAMMKKLIAECA